jgi:hypothetical protein
VARKEGILTHNYVLNQNTGGSQRRYTDARLRIESKHGWLAKKVYCRTPTDLFKLT